MTIPSDIPRLPASYQREISATLAAVSPASTRQPASPRCALLLIFSPALGSSGKCI
ncbi:MULTISPECIES: hypothetical protein [Pantoea]|uniref:Uncharacterized protein n=1 Tax=Pantoea brenneri TaxID=472694 RepID=A0A7Y6NEP1_9GAMM|nr:MULTISPECIES: hypothetical protein [Pantoea]MBZ6395759.1 hypothetical protein [Pantoea sp.]MBZ6439074.1 hypothetical protein [Pantoea sp.]MDU7866270.1 hypothetical protein [Pantoea sp.]NUY42084.1 hypothetical protein [Pantoea brenneri]NUY49709.1 hypothetical protein [Pantoea brenneri]